MYINDVVDQWQYPLAELLNYLSLSYDDYITLRIINAPLDRRTINFIKAIKLIYQSNKRVRYIRICKDEALHIMPIDLAIVRSCGVCGCGIKDVRALYCSNACRQKAYRERKSLKLPAVQQKLPFGVML